MSRVKAVGIKGEWKVLKAILCLHSVLKLVTLYFRVYHNHLGCLLEMQIPGSSFPLPSPLSPSPPRPPAPGNSESAGVKVGRIVWKVTCGEGLSYRNRLGSYCNHSGGKW